MEESLATAPAQQQQVAARKDEMVARMQKWLMACAFQPKCAQVWLWCSQNVGLDTLLCISCSLPTTRLSLSLSLSAAFRACLLALTAECLVCQLR